MSNMSGVDIRGFGNKLFIYKIHSSTASLCQHNIHRYTREIPEPAPFLSRHGAQIGGCQVLPVIKITVVCQICMSPTSTAVCGVKISTRKMPHGARGSWTHLICICFCAYGQQNPEDPQFEPMADNAIRQGGTYEAWDLPCISVVTS